MSERVSSLIIASLDDVTVGDYSPSLPLHITVVPPFKHEYSQTNELLTAISEQLHATEPFSITAGEDAMFGQDNSIHVRKIIGNQALTIIHNDLMRRLSLFPDVELDHTYADERYSPHSTFIGSRGLEQGEKRAISALYFAQKQKYLNARGVHKVWHIAERFDLGS